MAKVHVKKGDVVYVLTGKDKAKTGKVLFVDQEKNRVVVEGVNLVFKHRKPSGQQQQGGIDRFEGPIHASNVMIVDEKAGRPTRVRTEIRDGKKVRVSKVSGEVIDFGNDWSSKRG